MSNYPNMSYCMTENTVLALRQVVTAMVEEGPDFVQGLSPSELSAYRALFNLCEEFVATAEEIEEEIDRDEDDGQPDEAQEWADFDPDC